jgi:Fic family protein
MPWACRRPRTVRAIENIVTTHDELFRDDAARRAFANPAAKEVLRYRQALRVGFEQVRAAACSPPTTSSRSRRELERNNAGFRKLPGTALKDGAGQHGLHAAARPGGDRGVDAATWSASSTTPDLFWADPLIKMALIHHQFESIHPFYDGNGRTGRIVNVLYLVKEGLLDIPVLYLSSHIVRTKADYYRLLQTVRTDRWEDWVLYMLEAVEVTAGQTIATIHAIKRRCSTTSTASARLQVLQPGLDQQPVHAPVHQDRVRAAGPAGVAHDGHQVSRRAGRRRLRAQAEDWPQQLLHELGLNAVLQPQPAQVPTPAAP